MNALSIANLYHIAANGLHALPWATIRTAAPWLGSAFILTTIALTAAIVHKLHQRP